MITRRAVVCGTLASTVLASPVLAGTQRPRAVTIVRAHEPLEWLSLYYTAAPNDGSMTFTWAAGNALGRERLLVNVPIPFTITSAEINGAGLRALQVPIHVPARSTIERIGQRIIAWV